MAQAAVEQCIGRLLTDEATRQRFGRDPDGTLNGIAQNARMSLTSAEREALRAIAVERWHQMAEGIDPRLQRLSSPTEDDR